jgi:hypothetical protein
MIRTTSVPANRLNAAFRGCGTGDPKLAKFHQVTNADALSAEMPGLIKTFPMPKS